MGKTEIFKALSDPVRRNILELLKKEKMSAGAIACKFDLSGATVSYHLKTLKKANLVTEDKQRTFVYYHLNRPVLEEAMEWMEGLKKGK